MDSEREMECARGEICKMSGGREPSTHTRGSLVHADEGQTRGRADDEREMREDFVLRLVQIRSSLFLLLCSVPCLMPGDCIQNGLTADGNDGGNEEEMF